MFFAKINFLSYCFLRKKILTKQFFSHNFEQVEKNSFMSSCGEFLVILRNFLIDT